MTSKAYHMADTKFQNVSKSDSSQDMYLYTAYNLFSTICTVEPQNKGHVWDNINSAVCPL